MLKDLGVLTKDTFEEQKMSTLTGRHIGESESNTQAAIQRARGGVLFIDEVHQLCSDSRGNSFGQKILDTLMPELENLREELAVVFATYASKVEDFYKADPGLRRRVPEVIEFPDYSDNELAQILESIVKKEGQFELETGLAGKVSKMVGLMRGTDEFANAGSMRNAYEKAERKVHLRAYKRNTAENVMTAKDFSFLNEWVAKARSSAKGETVS